MKGWLQELAINYFYHGDHGSHDEPQQGFSLVSHQGSRVLESVVNGEGNTQQKLGPGAKTRVW